MGARSRLILLVLCAGCGSRSGLVEVDAAPIAVADVGVDDVVEDTWIAPDTATLDTATFDTATLDTAPTTSLSCAEWSLPTTLACKPTSVVMDDQTVLLDLDPETGACAFRKVDAKAPWPRVDPSLLWLRDRRNCWRSLCYGFDALHLGSPCTDSACWGVGAKSFGRAHIEGASAGLFDASAACGDTGCWRGTPVDTPITFHLQLWSPTGEVCRKLDLVLRYGSDRRLDLVSLTDR